MTKFINMTARYAGTCAGCGHWIRRGNQITFDPVTRKAYHIEHAPKPTAEEVQEQNDRELAAFVAAGLGEV